MFKNIYITLCLGLLIGCQNSNEVETTVQLSVSKTIDPAILDDQLVNNDGSINISLSDSAAQLYFMAYNESPEDSISPYYLIKSADIQRHIPGKALYAVEKYLNINKKYPNTKVAAQALFMAGLTFDQNLNDKERAAKVYKDFIASFPNHQMVNEAKNLLSIAENQESTDLEQVHKWMEETENK